VTVSLLAEEAPMGGEVGAVVAAAPPAWVEVQEEVSRNMAQIREKMGLLHRAHQKAALPTFSDFGDGGSSSAKDDVDVLTRQVTALFKKCEGRLKLLMQVPGGGQEGAKVRGNIATALAGEIQALSQDFRKQQKSYLQKLQRQKESVSGGGGSGGLIDFGQSSETGGGGGDTDFGFTEAQLLQAREGDQMSLERDKEVMGIAKSVEDLAMIMRDLSVLVIDQGSVVDRIDYNMEQTAEAVEKGVEELVKADKTQKNSRMFLCIMCLAVAVVLMTIVIVFKKIIFS